MVTGYASNVVVLEDGWHWSHGFLEQVASQHDVRENFLEMAKNISHGGYRDA